MEIGLNDVSLNGVSLNGVSLNDVSLKSEVSTHIEELVPHSNCGNPNLIRAIRIFLPEKTFDEH